ncbi:hypothetical protein B0H67DRAFT_648567 [Lasiosphaeris hirsuta]|uniref:Uncharacterized protein n=1 Tax=Lasiosphaeris hirsuta TaxID=260670 RepID=A0AA40A3C0_9PEZI|nr:hypothetical protein B0H67DRAFT_648567 [Lasiosphaeris hirsuta]
MPPHSPITDEVATTDPAAVPDSVTMQTSTVAIICLSVALAIALVFLAWLMGSLFRKRRAIRDLEARAAHRPTLATETGYVPPDHKELARELGLPEGTRFMTGVERDKMLDDRAAARKARMAYVMSGKEK